ncbi:hypothetical protein AALB81_03270 [Lachnospiraceae bacterium 48-33]
MEENKVYDVDFFNGCDWETQKWSAEDMPASVSALYASYGNIVAMECFCGTGAYSGTLEFYFTFVSGKRMLYRTVFGNWDNGTLLV